MAVPASAASAAGAATCAYAPASIAVVVDFGDGSSVSAVCVAANTTDNGASVLAARAQALGTPAPRFSSSGLLCAIDGTPSEGCGDQTGSKYAYWSYWHGTGGAWSYSNVGPGGARVHATTVEGWRFQPQGAGNPSDPPPRGSADPAATCAPAPVPSPPTSTAASSATSGQTPSTVTTTLAGDAAAVPGSTAVVSSTDSSSSVATTTAQAAAPVRVSSRDKGGGPVVGMLAGGGLVVALGVSGAVIARRRRATQ
jgi:hypothetical protein